MNDIKASALKITEAIMDRIELDGGLLKNRLIEVVEVQLRSMTLATPSQPANSPPPEKTVSYKAYQEFVRDLCKSPATITTAYIKTTGTPQRPWERQIIPQRPWERQIIKVATGPDSCYDCNPDHFPEEDWTFTYDPSRDAYRFHRRKPGMIG